MNKNLKFILIAIVIGCVSIGLIAWIAVASSSRADAPYPLISLNNGKLIPQIGFGTWKMNDAQTRQAVKEAVSVGYRHIDTAWRYQNEKGVGRGLKDLLDDNVIKREDVWVTTKVWNTYHGRQLAVEAIKESLRNLGLDYVDLALIHWPTGFKSGTGEQYPKYPNGTIIPEGTIIDTWRGFEDMYRQGLAKSIGISNFNIKQVETVLREGSIKPVTNQIEVHPFLTQDALVDYCQRNGVSVTAYSPLRQADPELLSHYIMREIGRTHNKTAAQVALRWLIQRDIIVIPKTSHKQRMIENFDIFDFNLSDKEMKQISSLNSNKRLIEIPGTQTHADYPFNY